MAGKFLWILDNGHGKSTPGKRSPVMDDGRQLLEYEFNRDIVSRLIIKLQNAGYSFHNLVPEVEGDVSLTQRVNKANNLQSALPKLYVSIHANAAGNGGWQNASGVETFCYKTGGKSERMAKVFQNQLIETLGWKNRGVKTENLYVLRYTDMPAVLTENGFYTDSGEVEKLLDNDWREKITEAHFQSIQKIENTGPDFFI